MKAITCKVALATIGLLALAACMHSGDDDEPRTEMDALNDSRDANSDEIRNVTAEAATSLPQFGSVVQSAAVNLAATSGISTTFDGTDLTIAVTRDDGSTLTLSTASEDSEGSGPSDSPIAGHTAQHWSVISIGDDGISVARAVVSANDSNAADYLSIGYWTHIAGDLTDPASIGVEVGTFADGPELSLASPASLPAQGTASYYGPAGGAYSVLHGTGEGGTPGSAEVGEFHSTVELTADFAANTIEGCVGCRDGVALFGTQFDVETGESIDVMAEDSGYKLHLHRTDLNSNGTFDGQQMELENDYIDIRSSTGAWGGQFSNIADSDGDPRLVAGTFGAEATSAGGSEGAFLGSFITTKE